MYWQNTKTLRYFFAFISIVVIASLVVIVGLGSRDHASALTSAQQHSCYDTWNGNNHYAGNTTSSGVLTMCLDAGYCLEGAAVDAGILGVYYPVTCTNPATQEAASAAASQATTAPLVTAVCGTAPAVFNQTGTYLTCSNKVVADYNACAMTGGPATSSVVDTPTNTAKCFVAKGNKISMVNAINAIKTGRAAGDAIITKAATAKAAAECAASGKVIVGGKCVAKPADPGPQPTCTIDGIGWIVCPVLGFVGTVSDGAYGFISSNFLNINVNLLKPTLPDGSANPTYSTWGVFRSIANVLFVIVFMIIVFSQLSSVGISSYGVKKMLPRLVIAAILVNVSYFVVLIAVDLSNILGYSLKSLFETLPVYTNASTSGAETVGQFATVAALGVAAVGVTAGALLAVSVPVLLAALVSVIMTLLILVARQAIIVILIIISPIAFVAWLLPNTEQWFKKWWKMFFSLLMVFPVIGLLFGAGKMASTVMQAVGAASGDHFLSVIAVGVAAIPLILVPSLLKNSLSATGALGAKLSGLSSKANSRVGGKVKNDSRLGEAMKNRQINSVQNRAKRRSRPGWQSGLDNSRLGKKLGFDRGARVATQIADKAFEEEVSAADIAQKTYSNDEINNAAIYGSIGGTEITDAQGNKSYQGGRAISNAERTAAARNIMKTGTSNQRRELYVAASGAEAEVRQAARDGFYANGDQKIYGADMGDAVHQGRVTSAAQLDDGIARKLNDEGVSTDVLVQDTRIAVHLARIAAAGGTANQAIAAEKIDRLREAAADATVNESTRGKVTGKMVAPISTLANLP